MRRVKRKYLSTDMRTLRCGLIAWNIKGYNSIPSATLYILYRNSTFVGVAKGILDKVLDDTSRNIDDADIPTTCCRLLYRSIHTAYKEWDQYAFHSSRSPSFVQSMEDKGLFNGTTVQPSNTIVTELFAVMKTTRKKFATRFFARVRRRAATQERGMAATKARYCVRTRTGRAGT